MEALGIETNLLIAQILNFALFFFIFKKFVAKPFSEFLKKEKQSEDEKKKATEKILKQEELLQKEEKEFKAKMKKSIDAEIAKAKEEASQLREKLVQDAQKDAEQIVLKAKEQMKEERSSLEKEMQTKAGDLAVFLVEKALSNYLDEDSKKRLTQYIITNVGKNVEVEVTN